MDPPKLSTSQPIMSLDDIGIQYIDNGILEKGKFYRGGDKTSLGQNFTKKYQELFEEIRDQPNHVLELGVLDGRSIAMWSDYFKNGHIVGVDINLSRYNKNKNNLEKLGAFTNNNYTVLELNIKEESFMEYINGLNYQFHIIIDDALHQPKQQFVNFVNLFSSLASGGIYIVEDLVKPSSVVEFFKDIIIGVSSSKPMTINSSKKKKKNLEEKPVNLSQIIRQIESIEFRKNMIVIKKQ